MCWLTYLIVREREEKKFFTNKRLNIISGKQYFFLSWKVLKITWKSSGQIVSSSLYHIRQIKSQNFFSSNFTIFVN